MTPGLGNGNKGGQIAVMVEQGVDLDPGLGLSEPGPGKEAQAEADRGRVQGEELVFEPELLFGSNGLTMTVDMPEQGLEEGAGRFSLASAKVDLAAGFVPRW